MSCTPTWDGTQPAQGKFCLTSFFSYVWKKLEVRIVNWIFMYTYNAIGISCTSRGPEYFRAGCIPIRTRSASRSRRTSSFGYTSANLPVLSLCLLSNAVKLLNLFLSHSWAEPCFDKFQAAEKDLSLKQSSDLIENLHRKRLQSARHMLYSLAGLKTQKDRRFEAATHQKYIGSKRRTNNKFSCWKILIPAKILFIWKCIQWNLDITKSSEYNELFFLTPVMVKYMAIWKRTSIFNILSQKRTSLPVLWPFVRSRFH